MDYTLGQCRNTQTCEIARSNQILRIDIDAAFVCSACNSPLYPPKVEEKSQLPMLAGIGAVLALIAGGAGYYFFLRMPAVPAVAVAARLAAPPMNLPAPASPAASDPMAAQREAVARAAAAADVALARETRIEQEAAQEAAARQAQAEAEKARAVELAQQAQATQLLTSQKLAAEKLAAQKATQAQQAQKQADQARAALEAQKRALAQAQAQQQQAASQLAKQSRPAPPPPSPPAPAPTQAAEATPEIPDHPFSARALSGGAPAYPEVLADNPRAGSVVVRCVIEESGHPSDCQVVSERGGLPFSASVQSWLASGAVRFAPITHHGQPVAKTQQWEIKFSAPEAASTD